MDAPATAQDVRAGLEKGIERRFGFCGGVVVRSGSSWETYVSANPFGEGRGGAKMVHMILSGDPPQAGAAEALAPRAGPGERICEAGGALWIDYGDTGAARSKLTPTLIDRACGSPATARNWNTVLKIAEMVRAR